ncbi:pseudouridine synthase [Polaromonas naphthalenivorans]|uniref:Pseudouridine synthase n=1 Tax=Polaromonas naphthalenivorans (strain CJ2) TaxID=365044 RepID=A1VNE9_POLNA|nr:pseudouridine synthase [Polaromonas naphthalenivorans]ABM37177.1 ribosomal large subunit pseudouridine synthase B [Polaromonas naphthalenivorans CJ2]
MKPQDNPASEAPPMPEYESNKVVPHDPPAQLAPDLIASDGRGKVSPSQATARRPGSKQVPATIRFEDVITGQFDADEDDVALDLPKRVLSPQPETPKLHKVLAQAGLGSRLEMEQLILEGRISVNAEPAHIGQRIQFGDTVKVNGKPIRVQIDPPPPRVIAYHKPAGEVVTHDDPQNRPTVFRRLPKLFQGKWQSVGRLDLNTEGLLLLTSSGELANKLMHPRFGLEREYAVRVLGALNNEEKKRLLDGVTLDDGVAQFGSIEAGGGEGANCWYRVTISEGRNREVRRMFEAVGHAVSRLIRIRYGAMVLPRGLKRGAFVELDENDIHALTSAVSRSESRPDPRGEAAGPGQSEGEGGVQQRRGPRRNERPRSGAGRPRNLDAGQSGVQQPLDDSQPPMNRTDSAPRGNRRNAGGGAGPRGRSQGGNSGPGARFGQAGAGGPQGQKRRDDRNPRSDKSAGGSQPDPMKTSFGYIGADTFTRQRQDQGQRRGGGGGNAGGFGGTSGGPRRNGGNTGGNRGGGNRGGNR